MGETFVLPKAQIQEETQFVIGTDGNKMSKSKNNIINIFQPDKALRKQIMSIQTDSKTIEEPKDPENCTVFKIFSLYQMLSKRKFETAISGWRTWIWRRQTNFV